MTLNEVIGFILPQTDDLIQISFLFIILVMMLGTVFSVQVYANESSWQKKWNRGKPNDTSHDMGIEHGSVTDLWHAVATAPEKVAEIMPGMLLVIGLLGTFLGLGLALNKASSILGQANAMSAGVAADSMNNLMGLLQGLGTKFKTSTWGISGFVLLKIWSEAMRYDEKRLAWVIDKVKIELTKRKQEKEKDESNKRKELHTEIATTADKVVNGLVEQFRSLLKQEYLQHKESMVRLDELKSEISATKENMQTFTESTQRVVKQMAEGATSIGEAANRMAEGADKVGNAGSKLVVAVDEFKTQFTNVLGQVRNDLGKSIQDMSAQAAGTLEKGSAQLSSATHEISKALGDLSRDVNKTMTEVKDSIEKALNIQQNASKEFTVSAQTLNEYITKTTSIVEKLAKPIAEGLSNVSASNQHVKGVGNSLNKSLEAIQKVITNLEQLPIALQPVSQLAAHQQQMISVLEPLSHLPRGQQQIIQEMQRLSAELKSIWTTPKDAANHQPVTAA